MKHRWSGRWPTDEFPKDGTRIRWTTRDGTLKEGVIEYVWCGIEPVFQMVGGSSVFPGLEDYEVIG